jgi:hypothetical protein
MFDFDPPRRLGLAVLAGVLGAAAVVGVAAAQPSGSGAAPAADVRVELNRLEPRGDACRTYLVLQNTSGAAYKSLKLDLFVFDTGGVVAQRLAVEAGPLPAKKTSVKLFDFPGITCERFGRVLLNDVLTCEQADGTTRDDCLGVVDTASKGSVPFGK